MLKVRLQRVGRKNDPSFRVVVTDSKNGPKSGKFIEVLGSYDARKGDPIFKAERIKHWLAVGAQASGTLHNLLVDKKIIAGKKINVLPKKTKIVKPEEAKPEEVKPAVAEVKAEEVIAEEAKTEETSQVEAEDKSAPAEVAPEVKEEVPVAEETTTATT